MAKFLFMLTKSYFYSVKLLRMYKKHLLFLLFTSLFAWKSNAQNASANINDLIQKSFTAMANVKTMTYHFYASERMDDGTYSKSDVEFKVVASPLKIFANAHEPQSAKLSYDASKSKDVKVKKGLSLSLSPTNKLLMKGVHNPITRAGFGRIKMILEKSLAQRKGQDLSKYVKLAGTVMYDNKECLKVVISDPDYKIIDYTVKPGQTNVWQIGSDLAISEYKIKELNGIGDDVKPGQKLKIPSSYAKVTTIYFDKATNLPVFHRMEDEKGVYETYEFKNLKTGMTFTDADFQF